MPSSTAPTTQQLQNCINLVTSVSYRAKNKEFKNRGPADIQARMQDNGWHTWWNPANGAFTACAFFQWIRQRPISSGTYNYAMCIGFSPNSYPMAASSDCQAFLNAVVGGTDGDGLLWDYIKNVLGVPFVYVVDAPELAVDSVYSYRRNALFVYMQTNSPGARWKMTLDLGDTNQNFAFWGGNGLNLWKLTLL